MFEIKVDRSQAFISIQLSGLWTTETLSHFKTELQLSVAKLGSATNRFVCACDLTEFSVQTSVVAQDFLEFLQRFDPPPKRSAIIIIDTLPRLQARRVMEKSDGESRYFSDRATALEWLGVSDR